MRSAPLPLVGREHERSLLRDGLADALARQGRLILISGEAGIGKTALAVTLCREAEEQDALVLIGRCDGPTATSPYGLWIDLFARVQLASPSPPPLPAAFAERGTVGRVPSPALLARQVEGFLASLLAVQPVVLMLDDLHWADPASLELLRMLVHSPSLPALIIGIYRSDEVRHGSPLAAMLPALVRDTGADRLDLRPLTDADVRALIAGRYRLADADMTRLVAYLRAHGEGNPLFLIELLRTLEAEGALHPFGDGWVLADLAAVGVPPLLRQMVERRMEPLGDETRRLLGIAAAIGNTVPLALWAQVGETDERTLLDVAERAVGARLMDELSDGSGVRFVHALIRDAIDACTSPLRRRAWHRTIAEALAAADGDPDAVAAHFSRAGDPRAAIWLYHAGMRATRLVASATAVAHYEAALTALAAASDNHGGIATELENAALAEHIRCALGDERCRLRAYRRGVAEMEGALTTLAALPAQARASAEAMFGIRAPHARTFDGRSLLGQWLAATGDFARAVMVNESVMADGTSAGIAYTGLMLAHAGLGHREAAIDVYRRGRDAYLADGRFLWAAVITMHAVIWINLPYAADAPSARRALADQAERWFERARPPHLSPRFAHLPRLVVEGEWQEVQDLALATRALGYGAIYGAIPLRALATIAYARGDADLAWTMVREGLPHGADTEPGDAIFPNAELLQRIAAGLRMDAGDHAGARAWLEAHDCWLTWSGAALGRVEGLLAWATYHQTAGEPEQAQVLATHALHAAAGPRQPLALLAAHRALGELATAGGCFDEAGRHLDAALALAEACMAPYERALTLLARAALDTATGEREQGLAAREEAQLICERLGARAALARADALTTRSRATPGFLRLPDGLSAREADVLRLIAAGKSNTEIAAALSISVRTVARHITNLYTKIDARNKADATAYAYRHRLV